MQNGMPTGSYEPVDFASKVIESGAVARLQNPGANPAFSNVRMRPTRKRVNRLTDWVTQFCYTDIETPTKRVWGPN